MPTMLIMRKIVYIIISNIAQSVYMRFSAFSNCSKLVFFFGTFWLLRNFYSGDARHANYANNSLNHHFRYCANCVYQIYSVFQLFEIPVCFAHFGCYEISTPVMRTMLTMPNVVYIIISNIPPTVYIRYTTFWNSSELFFVLHILAFTKFQLRWYAPFQLLWTLFKSSFLPLRSLWKSDFNCYQTFRNCSLFWHILDYMKFLLRLCAQCYYIREGGGRIGPKERLFPCEKRSMVKALHSTRVSHIILASIVCCCHSQDLKMIPCNILILFSWQWFTMDTISYWPWNYLCT